jgi:hypothetical protein
MTMMTQKLYGSALSVSICIYTLILFISLVVGCSPESAAKLIPPPGWTKEPPQIARKEIEVLFAGKRDEGTAKESHLVVLYAPDMKSKENARGTIGAFLDGFWKKDPNLFMAISVHAIEVDGRHPLYVRLSGASVRPPQPGLTQTYIFMTEIGLYHVSYSTQGEGDFRLDDFLKNSLLLRAKESGFAQDVIAEYIKNLPEVQARHFEQLHK